MSRRNRSTDAPAKPQAAPTPIPTPVFGGTMGDGVNTKRLRYVLMLVATDGGDAEAEALDDELGERSLHYPGQAGTWSGYGRTIAEAQTLLAKAIAEEAA